MQKKEDGIGIYKVLVEDQLAEEPSGYIEFNEEGFKTTGVESHSLKVNKKEYSQ